MCNNNVKIGERNERIDKLKNYSVRILSGESCKEIAEREGILESVVLAAVEEINLYNPALYRQLKKKM